MTRRLYGLPAAALVALSAALCFATEAHGDSLENALRSRWLGTWVVIRAELGSDCDNLFTNNRILEGRTVHDADFVLPPGELAKVVKLDVKRARVDVFVELSEPLLASRVRGPFELFDKVVCRVELQTVMPRTVIKSQDNDAAGEILGRLLQRHESRQAASVSPLWNQRRVQLLPEGYEETLAEYDEWKARQFVAELQDRLDEVLDEAVDIVERAQASAAYTDGLAQGLRRGRSSSLGRDCESLVDESFYPSSEDAPGNYDGRGERDWEDGYRDAQRLAFSIELADRLELCLR